MAAIIYKTIISNLRLNSIIDKIAIIRKIDPKELLEFINFFLLHECVRLVFWVWTCMLIQYNFCYFIEGCCHLQKKENALKLIYSENWGPVSISTFLCLINVHCSNYMWEIFNTLFKFNELVTFLPSSNRQNI